LSQKVTFIREKLRAAKGGGDWSNRRRSNFGREEVNSSQGRANFRRGVINFSRRCYLCDGSHLFEECPHKTEFDKFLSTSKAKSKERTLFTAEPHFLD